MKNVKNITLSYLDEEDILGAITPGYEQKRWILAYQKLIELPFCKEKIKDDIFQDLFNESNNTKELTYKILSHIRSQKKYKTGRAPRYATKTRNKKYSIKKEVEEIKKVFNHNDYTYLKNLPPEGWIWEFERRKDEYVNTYQIAVDRIKSLELELKKQIPFKNKNKDTLLMLIVHDIFASFRSKHNVHIDFLRSEIPLVKKLKEWPRRQVATRIIPYPPAPGVKFNDLPEFIKIIAKSATKAYWFPASSITHPEDCLYIMNSVLVPDESKKESTLYIGVDLTSNITDIINEIEEAIRNTKKNLPYAQVDATKSVPEWNEYLKVYDLRKKGFSNNAIASFLFPKIKKPADKATSYFQSANKLINKNHYRIYF